MTGRRTETSAESAVSCIRRYFIQWGLLEANPLLFGRQVWVPFGRRAAVCFFRCLGFFDSLNYILLCGISMHAAPKSFSCSTMFFYKQCCPIRLMVRANTAPYGILLDIVVTSNPPTQNKRRGIACLAAHFFYNNRALTPSTQTGQRLCQYSNAVKSLDTSSPVWHSNWRRFYSCRPRVLYPKPQKSHPRR